MKAHSAPPQRQPTTPTDKRSSAATPILTAIPGDPFTTAFHPVSPLSSQSKDVGSKDQKLRNSGTREKVGQISRDEMNLAEFPLTVLSTRANPSLKTLEFTDTLKGKNGEQTTRHWIITGADKFGLPTASDDEVLLGLLKLTVDDGMRARRVYFTRYELLKVLRWTTEGRNYTRLQRALDRLTGVRIKATNAFYDNNEKSYSTRNFGIIDSYEINCGREGDVSSSFFEWSDVLFSSFKSGFIKKLDWDVYLSLESAVAKRLYRYLDKHFWFKSRLELNLFVLAHEKVGISRNYRYPSLLRQQLDPALEELCLRNLISSFEYKGKGKDTTLIVFGISSTPRAVATARATTHTDYRDNHSPSQSGHSPSELGLAKNPYAPNGVAYDSGPDIKTFGGDKNREIMTLNSRSDNSQSEDLGGDIPTNSVGKEDSILVTNRGLEWKLGNLFSQIVDALVRRGLTESQALRLLDGRVDAELQRVGLIIEHFDALLTQKSLRVSRSPIGFLYRAVENFRHYRLPSDAKSVGAVANQIAQARSSYGTGHGGGGNSGSWQKDSSTTRPLASRNGRSQDTKNSPSTDELNREVEYLVYRRRKISELRAALSVSELAELTSGVEAALSKLKGIIRSENFKEAVEHAVAEKIAKIGKIPSYAQWLAADKN